jgi:hypothetical protein
MVIQSFLGDYNFIWIFVILVIVIYAGLKKIGLPGNDFVLALTAFLLSFIVLSSTKATNYLVAITPFLTILLVLTVLVTLVLIFVTNGKILDNFKKYMAWMAFIIGIIIVLYFAFSQFSALHYMLPSSSTHGLTGNELGFRNFIYSDNFKESAIFIVAMVIVGFAVLKTTVKK